MGRGEQIRAWRLREGVTRPVQVGGLGTALRRLPLGLALAAALTSAAAGAPLLYIAFRAAGAPLEVWLQIWTSQMPRLLNHTLALVATTTALSVALGVGLAWCVERTDVPGRAVWRWALAMPLAIPAYIAAVCAVLLLRRGGLIDAAVAGLLGGQSGQVPLPAPYGLGGATVVISLCTYPYVYLPVAAALRSMSCSCEEAARMAGRGAWATFRQVTLPMILPAVLGGAALVSLYAMSDFGTVAVLRYPTFTTAIYNQFTGQLDRAAASILSLVLVGLSVPLLVGETWLTRRWHRASQTPAWRPPQPIRLGRWRWAALAGVSGVAALAMGVPVLLLGGLSLQGLLFPTAVDGIWSVGGDHVGRQGLNSALTASLAATLAMALAAAPAYLAVRHPGWLSHGLLHGCRLATALPGLIVGLGFVMAFSQFAPVIHGTIAALGLGLSFRLLPYAVSSNVAGLGAVPASLEQAARGMGCRPRQAFLRVVLPVAAPSVMAGWALAFIAAMKELPTAIMLRPAGFDTLPVRIWSAAGESVYTQAAPPALLLITLTALPLIAVYARGGFGLAQVLDEGG